MLWDRGESIKVYYFSLKAKNILKETVVKIDLIWGGNMLYKHMTH